MRPILLFALFASLQFHSIAQEQFGIASGNYSPTNSLFLNPAGIAGSHAYRDIHLAGANVFVDNDLLFLSKRDFKLTRGVSQFDSDAPMPVHNSGSPARGGYVNAQVQGPSFSMVMGRFAFAVHTAARSVVDFRGISSEMGNYIFNGLEYDQQRGMNIKEKHIRANGLAWAEAGLTLGGVLVQSNQNMLSVGATARRLVGISGGTARIDDINFQVGDTTDFDLQNLSARAGYAEPGWNSGRGWAANLGFTYKRMKEDVSHHRAFSKESGCKAPEYKYKIGVSLLDFGKIKFDRGVTFYQVEGLSLQAADYNDQLPESMEALDSLLLADVGAHVSQPSSFSMALPTALSVQFDWNFGRNFYASATWMHGFGRAKKLGVQRAGVVNVTPRFETRRFEVALPVSLYQYKYPRIGLALRFNNIIIGTDRIGPLLFNPDVYGMDLYVSLKYTIFRSKACKTRKVKSAKVTQSTIVDCPTWD